MATQTLTTTSGISTARPKWTLLQRFWNAMIKAQQARADRCVADYLQNIGWMLAGARTSDSGFRNSENSKANSRNQ
jgi:hypothetical protein